MQLQASMGAPLEGPENTRVNDSKDKKERLTLKATLQRVYQLIELCSLG